jgi:hypothetical protein
VTPPVAASVRLKVVRWILGVSLGVGLLVVINQLQIPYYLYYPRIAHTILISDAVDFYFFLTSSVSAPLILYLTREKLSKSAVIGLGLVWAVSLCLTALNEPWAVVILYAALLASAVLVTLKSAGRRVIAADVLLGTLTVLVLVECPAVFYWVGAALSPQQRLGFVSEQVEANLTYSLYPIVIPLLLLLLFSWLWIPLLSRSPALLSAVFHSLFPHNLFSSIPIPTT